jgi:hypothetical protein
MKYQATGENSGPDLHFTSHSRIDRADLVSAAARLKWQSIPAYHKFSHVRSGVLSRATPAEHKEHTVVVVVVVSVEVAVVVVVVVVVVRGREEEETNRRRTRGEQEKNKRREQQENNKRRANKEDEGDQGYSLGRPHPPY